MPSGQLQSPRSIPAGSSSAGIPAHCHERRMASFMAVCRGRRPMLKRHDSGCIQYSSTFEPHWQRYGVQTQGLSRIETARRKLSLSSRHPISVLG